SWTMNTSVGRMVCMMRVPIAKSGRVSTKSSSKPTMHGRQGRKDRGELARHGRGVPNRRAKEEFGALARLAQAAQQPLQEGHGTTLRAGAAAPNGVCYCGVV